MAYTRWETVKVCKVFSAPHRTDKLQLDLESSSEDTFASYAIKMWGKVTGDANMEARGDVPNRWKFGPSF
jgi:glycosyl hydrolase family 81